MPCEGEGREPGKAPTSPGTPRSPAKPQKLGQTALPVSQRKPPAHTLVSDFRLPELQDNPCLLFKPPSLWCFVAAALANEPRAIRQNPLKLKRAHALWPSDPWLSIWELTLQMGSHAPHAHVWSCSPRYGLKAKSWKRPRWPSEGHWLKTSCSSQKGERETLFWGTNHSWKPGGNVWRGAGHLRCLQVSVHRLFTGCKGEKG